jgi:hypothetical protein
MSPTDLETMIFDEPFRPFRVTLSGGDQYDVNNVDRVMLVGLVMAVGLNDDPQSRIGTRLKLISIPNIVTAEHIDPTRPRGRRRR